MHCLKCSQSPACDFVYYNNPTPVVACIVECAKRGVLLVQNIGWPATFFGIVTGFLEADDTSPASAILRELHEEVGVSATEAQLTLLEVVSFARMNQVIIVYHVLLLPDTRIQHDPAEIAAVKWVPLHKLRPWSQGTGPPLARWLKTRLAAGHANL